MTGARMPRFCAPQNHIGSGRPHASKLPARRAECSLTENANSPFHAEPEQVEVLLTFNGVPAISLNCRRSTRYLRPKLSVAVLLSPQMRVFSPSASLLIQGL